MRGSTKKSPIKRNVVEIKLTRVICFWMGKTYTAKTTLSDFKVTTPKNPLLSKQAVTTKWIPVSYTNLQLNPYSNTQLDLFCSDNLSFQCTAPNTWLTNRCADPNTQLNHQLEKNVGCKILQFITQWRLRSSLVIKPYGIQIQQFLQEKDELEQILSPVTICINKTLLHTCKTCVTFNGPQNNPYICLGCDKRKSKHIFTDWMKNSSEKLSFINLNR